MSDARTTCIPERAAPADKRSRAGLLFGIGAYTIWGIIPVYFRAVSHVPPFVVLCHRILWSALFMGLLITLRGEWKPILEALKNRRTVLLLSVSASLVALNWLIFIYAVSSRQVLQASLGYFVNPLLSILLGVLFLRERLRAWQWTAVAIAAAAVGNMAWRGVRFPWIAASLAASFGFYGLVRKKVDINSLHGLLVESALLLPLAVVALAVLPPLHVLAGTWGLLSSAGVITAVPLLLFGAAVRRLRLSTMGFLQYVGPTLQFLVATCLFGEALDPVKLGSFILSWVAIAVYLADSILHHYPLRAVPEPE